MTDLRPLFWPGSIALVGASPDPTIIRGRIVEAVCGGGFEGKVYPISRSHAEIRGLKTYPSVDALPEAVDLAIITIPAEHVAGALESCGKRGTRAAIIISSGFAEERGEAGAERQRAVVEIARRYGMAVCGPNAEGYLNSLAPVRASCTTVM